MAVKNKPQTITEVMNAINEKIPGAMRLASDDSLRVRKIPTGILPFDKITGGGIALGRWYEIYGQESVLKSVLSTAAASAFQNEFTDKHILWVDAEGSFDPDWVKTFDIDMSRINVLSHPQNGEQVVSSVETALESGLYSLVVVDSITALIPKRETEYDPEDAEKAVGAAGRLTSAMGRRLTRFMKDKYTIIIINQLRDNIGGLTFGDPAKPTGGRAIRYYAGQRIELRRGETIKQKQIVIGASGKEQTRNIMSARVINMRIEKDKIGSCEGRQSSLLWYPREGRIDEEEYLLTLGMEYGFVKRSSSSVTVLPDDNKYGFSVRGWDNAKSMLIENALSKRKLKRLISREV